MWTVCQDAAVSVFNHLGQCVTDLERSKRFYIEVLGFEAWRELSFEDEGCKNLLRLTPPIDMTASYLRRDGLVLELLHFAGSGAAPLPPRERVMNEPGLTHISISVDDIPGTCARIVEYGGEVLPDTDIGAGLFVRDPDGQLIELLTMDYAERVAAEG
jgi:catechol 2,3-dioxygenase-like lactoylglutathione lyase family enzyme